MSIDTEPHNIGTRLRRMRRAAGLSLDALAGLSGLSKSFLSRIENGQRHLDRRTQLAALSEALKCSIADLVGEPEAKTRQARQLRDLVPAVRHALWQAEGDPLNAGPRVPLAVLVRNAAEIWQHRKDADPAAALAALPNQIRATATAAQATEDRSAALHLLLDALGAAVASLRATGAADLRWSGAQLAQHVAAQTGDPAADGYAQLLLAQSASVGASYSTAGRIAENAADQLRPHAETPDELRIYGTLLMTMAIADTIAGNVTSGDAVLAEADDVARRVGEADSAGDKWRTYFGPLNLTMWRTSIAGEIGDADRIVALGEEITPSALGSRSRAAAFWSEYGCAIAKTSSRAHEQRALRALLRAEQIAPGRVHNDRHVRAAVANLLDNARSRAVAGNLATLARRINIKQDSTL